MANYKSTQVAGESWQRCHNVSISNTYNTVPIIYFQEERKFPISDTELGTTGMGYLSASMNDPTVTFPLLDIDGIPTGESKTYMDIYLMMNSLYMELARIRDTPPPEMPVIEEPPIV